MKPTHLRAAVPDDESAVLDLAVTNRMFAVDELDGFREAFRGGVTGEVEDHVWWVLATADDRVVAAAYVAPEPFGDRVWNLYFIAVAPDDHDAGAGTRLIGHVEEELRAAGPDRARVLVVETSSLEQYDGARRFYRARGYDEEARIREFYGPGDDKIVFWKSLIT